MRILCTEQGTPEWHKFRAGRITASRMQKVLSKPDTIGYKELQSELVLDLSGVDQFIDDDKPWFAHGKENEPHARAAYSWQYNHIVETTGFIIHDSIEYVGCSPDGLLIGEDGLAEFKCRAFLRTYHKAVKSKPGDKAQLQGQLWICGRDFNDYVNYWRDDDNDIEKVHSQRVGRDEPYIKRLAEACERFYAEVIELHAKRQQKQ